MVFCHVIETRDEADIARLGAFVTSIQPAAAASDAAAKLHRLFQVLHGVAARWVELPAGYGDDEGQPKAAEERDIYMRLLYAQSPGESGGGAQHGQGLAVDLEGNPAAHGAGVEGITSAEAHAAPALVSPMMRMGHGAQLEEWFYSNQALMESFQAFSHDLEAGEDQVT